MFSYLYLMLCYYILPASAITLKIRTKKLAAQNTDVVTTTLLTGMADSLSFFDTITAKLYNVNFVRNELITRLNFVFNSYNLKNEVIYHFKYMIFCQLKIITLYF